MPKLCSPPFRQPLRHGSSSFLLDTAPGCIPLSTYLLIIVYKSVVLNPSSGLARNAISTVDSHPILEAVSRNEANQIFVDASMTGRVIFTAVDDIVEE